MIGKISGRLDWRGGDHILIDVRGVGYIVYVSERTMATLPQLGGPVALYTELMVREDLLQLFGFPNLLEKEWHKLLMSVQGVGAKAALAILGALGAEGVARAITLSDVRAVQAAPGVGPKLAQRVILELKSKAPALMALGASLASSALPESPPVIEDDVPNTAPKGTANIPTEKRPTKIEQSAAQTADALSALINLGYAQGDAAEVVARVSVENPDLVTSELILHSLRLLAPKSS